jgi:hypothetical protein
MEENGTTDMCQWHSIDDLGSLQVVELVFAVETMLKSV